MNQQIERQMERPAQVTVLAALAMLAGVIGVLIGAYTILSGTVFASASPPTARPTGVIILIAFIELVIGGLYIAFSAGSWRLRRWAWPLGLAGGSLALIANGIRLIYDIFTFAKGEPVTGIVGPILALIVGGVILYYLFSDTVQRAFDL